MVVKLRHKKAGHFVLASHSKNTSSQLDGFGKHFQGRMGKYWHWEMGDRLLAEETAGIESKLAQQCINNLRMWTHIRQVIASFFLIISFLLTDLFAFQRNVALCEKIFWRYLLLRSLVVYKKRNPDIFTVILALLGATVTLCEKEIKVVCICGHS